MRKTLSVGVARKVKTHELTDLVPSSIGHDYHGQMIDLFVPNGSAFLGVHNNRFLVEIDNDPSKREWCLQFQLIRINDFLSPENFPFVGTEGFEHYFTAVVDLWGYTYALYQIVQDVAES